MKQYNVAILFILILLTISVSSYFFYLDIIYKEKVVKNDIEVLHHLDNIAKKPIINYANEQELTQKSIHYQQLLDELNIEAHVQKESPFLLIEGVINDTISYLLLKQLLSIIKNDDVNIISTCVGKGCTSQNYGFLIKIRPYTLKLQQ